MSLAHRMFLLSMSVGTALAFSSCKLTDDAVLEEKSQPVCQPVGGIRARYVAAVCIDTTTPTPLRATIDFIGQITAMDSSSYPDSLQIEVGGRTVRGSLVSPTEANFEMRATVDSSMARDTVVVRLFAKSIHYVTLHFAPVSDVWSGDKYQLLWHVSDSVAYALLDLLYASKAQRTAASVDSIYASVLVAGDRLGEGFPASAPAGIDTGTVRLDALRQVVAAGRPLAEAVSRWKLDLDYQAARGRILSLVPHISTQDSAALFP